LMAFIHLPLFTACLQRFAIFLWPDPVLFVHVDRAADPEVAAAYEKVIASACRVMAAGCGLRHFVVRSDRRRPLLAPACCAARPPRIGPRGGWLRPLIPGMRRRTRLCFAHCAVVVGEGTGLLRGKPTGRRGERSRYISSLSSLYTPGGGDPRYRER